MAGDDLVVALSLTHNEINLLLDAIEDFIADEERFRKRGLGKTPTYLPPKNQRRVDAINAIKEKLLRYKAK